MATTTTDLLKRKNTAPHRATGRKRGNPFGWQFNQRANPGKPPPGRGRRPPLLGAIDTSGGRPATGRKVMIAGSRGGGPQEAPHVARVATWATKSGAKLVTGDARGVDTLAQHWASRHGHAIEIHRVPGERTAPELRARTHRAVTASTDVAVISTNKRPGGRPGPPTPGSRLTIRYAIEQGKSVIVHGADPTTLPKEPGGTWNPINKPGWEGWVKYKPPQGRLPGTTIDKVGGILPFLDIAKEYLNYQRTRTPARDVRDRQNREDELRLFKAGVWPIVAAEIILAGPDADPTPILRKWIDTLNHAPPNVNATGWTK